MRPPLSMILLLALAACSTPSTAIVSRPALQGTPTPFSSQPLPTLPPTATITLTPTELPGPWKLVKVHNVHQNVMVAGFLTEDYGITVGVYPGNPFYTTDGGTNWTAGAMLSDCRYGMDIVSTRVAWTCGGIMNVRRSTDGGQNWPAVTDFGQGTTRPCHTISFLDETTGWLATLYMFGSTRDGGTTWTMVPQPEGLAKIASIDLVAPGQGYLLDFSGALFATQDNGAHWTRVARLDLDGMVIPEAAYQMAAMRFIEDGRGLIVVSEEYRSGRVKAFHTSDGGRTWSSELIPILSGPVFLSRQEPLLTVLNGAGILSVLRYTGD